MTMLAIPITKAKKNHPVDTEWFSDDIYTQIFAEGLKGVLNKGMTGDKFKTTDLEGEELEEVKASVYAKAEANLAALREGQLKRKRSASKESREVTTEARRLAREAVKAAIKEANKKVSGIPASVITQMADELIAEDEAYLAKARENVARMK